MKSPYAIVVVGTMLLAGASSASPPALTQEEAREAVLQQNRGAPYVDLAACSSLDRRAQELTQLEAALQLAAPDRGPVISGGACRTRTSPQVVAAVDASHRR